MRKAGNPRRPGNGSPGMKTLLSTPLNVDHQIVHWSQVVGSKDLDLLKQQKKRNTASNFNSK